MYKDFFVRFRGLRGTHVWYFYIAFSGFSENRHSGAFRVYGVRLKVIFGALECSSSGEFRYSDVEFGGLTYLLFVESR
jgi:hypothetical protein